MPAPIISALNLERTLTIPQPELQDIVLTDVFDNPLSPADTINWNYFDHVKLAEVPHLLKTSIIESEDRRFYTHYGIDLRGKLSALKATLGSSSRRGGSTISEQVIRIINPRPRTIKSKILEMIDSILLESSTNKDQILEFYLNQVPFGGNRRGISRGSRYYFGRDLKDLNDTELIALSVIIQAPSRLNPGNQPEALVKKLDTFVKTLVKRKVLEEEKANIILSKKLLATPSRPSDEQNTDHFLRFAKSELKRINAGILSKNIPVATTLNPAIQNDLDIILKSALNTYSGDGVKNSAIMVMDYNKNEIKAWLSRAGPAYQSTKDIDASLVPRQPGSSLKPFLYALSFDKGKSPDSIIVDEALTNTVGFGLHYYRNYSSRFYGSLLLNEALANSLNIPAIKLLRFCGYEDYLNALKKLGLNSLNKGADYYSDGLALGSGEVTLYEMMGAYATLARGGIYKRPRLFRDLSIETGQTQVFSKESTSMITEILSDRDARRLEFGRDSLLHYSQETAVKTGTSSEHRDAWIFAYNSQYLVGIWMGALDYSATNKMSGARGPALILKNIFKTLEPYTTIKKPIVSDRSKIRNTSNTDNVIGNSNESIKVIHPTPNLHLAIHPRIPENNQKFRFLISGIQTGDMIEWKIGKEIIKTESDHLLWQLRRGKHFVRARVLRNNFIVHESSKIPIIVK